MNASNEQRFLSLEHARQIIEDQRIDYNTQSPHSWLDYLTPDEFIQKQARSPKNSAAQTQSNELVLSNS